MKMKTLNFSTFSEKLKINPVDLDKFNNLDIVAIHDSYKKQNLKTGDMCKFKIYNCFGVVILNGDADLKKYNLDTYCKDYDDIIIFHIKNNWTFIPLNSFDDDLNYTFYDDVDDWDVVKVITGFIDKNDVNEPNTLLTKLNCANDKYKNI